METPKETPKSLGYNQGFGVAKHFANNCPFPKGSKEAHEWANMYFVGTKVALRAMRNTQQKFTSGTKNTPPTKLKP